MCIYSAYYVLGIAFFKMFTYLIIITTLWEEFYYVPHFMGAKTDAREKLKTHNAYVVEPGFKLGCLSAVLFQQPPT